MGTLFGLFLSLMSWSNRSLLPKIFNFFFSYHEDHFWKWFFVTCMGELKILTTNDKKHSFLHFFSIVNIDCSESIVTMCKMNVVNLKKRKRFLIQVPYFKFPKEVSKDKDYLFISLSSTEYLSKCLSMYLE